MIPATIVGSANGRSISELTSPLPGNSSRTRTQAIAVPATTLIATTISRAIRVSFSAASACGMVTSSQNALRPPVERLRDDRRERDQDDQAQIADDQATRERGAPEAGLRPASGALARLGARRHRATGLTITRWNPQVLLDLGDEPFSGSKKSVVTLSQPPRSIVDREQVRRGRELVLVLRQHRLVHRPVAAVGPELLGLAASQVVDEVLRLRSRRRSWSATGVSIRIVSSGTT